MPRFKEYAAPDKAFSEDTTGFSAFETAGRRVGPLYNSAGQDLRGAGQAGVNAAEAGVRGARDALGLAESNTRLSEDELRQQREQDRQSITNRTWPYDALALTLRGSQGKQSGGGGFKVEGGVGGGGHADRGSGGRGSSPGRASAAAAGLGQLASGMAQRAPYAARQDFDSQGNLIYDSRNPRAFQQPTTYLDHGQLVHRGQKGPGDVNGEQAAEKWANGPNGPQGPQDTGVEGEAPGGISQDPSGDFGGGSDSPAPDQDYGGGGDGWFNGITNSIGSMFGGSGSSTGGGGDDYGEE